MIPSSYQEAITGKAVGLDTYNDGYTHEAIHTTYVLMETFARHVMDCRCADEFPDVKRATDFAHLALFELYNLLGSKFQDFKPAPSGEENAA